MSAPAATLLGIAAAAAIGIVVAALTLRSAIQDLEDDY